MTRRTTNREHAVETDCEKGDSDPHFKCQIDQAINIDQKKIVEDHVEEKGERKDFQELRGRHRGRPPVLRKKKSSYDLRDIFQTQAASSASSSPVASNVSSPVIPSPDADKVISLGETITAPAQQQQQTTPLNHDSRPHDKNVPEEEV